MRRALAPPARVLVRMPSWLGDFVVAEPVVRALHARFARASQAASLAIAGPERLLALIDGRFEGARRLPVREHQREDFRVWRGHDVALLLNGSWSSAWTALRAGIPERIGLARGARSPVLSIAVEPARERGSVPIGLGVSGRWPRALPRPFGSVCVEMAAMLGLEVRERRPLLVPDARWVEAARRRLSQQDIDLGTGASFILVHAGARPGSAKSLPAETWCSVLDALQDRVQRALVVACAPGEEANAREAVRGARSAVLLDDPPPGLGELVALTSLASVVVTADSGPRHVARALSRPCVVACGPTDPRHTADHERDVRVQRVEVDCGPCHREVCPLSGPGNLACMRRVDPALVAQAALGLLDAPRARSPRIAGAPPHPAAARAPSAPGSSAQVGGVAEERRSRSSEPSPRRGD